MDWAAGLNWTAIGAVAAVVAVAVAIYFGRKSARPKPSMDDRASAPVFIHPDKPNHAYNTAMVCFDAGRYKAAVKHFKQALRLQKKRQASPLDPETAKYRNSLGVCYERTAQYVRAIKQYEAAIIILYDNKEKTKWLANTYCNRGGCYGKQSNYDAARTDFSTAIEWDPDCTGAYYNRGISYIKQGNYNSAMADFNKAIELNPKDAEAYCNRGVCYGNKGDYDAAMTDYNEAIRLKPNCADTYNNRGNCYGRQGNYNRAIQDFEKALALDPNDKITEHNLALAIKLKEAANRRGELCSPE